MVATIAPPPKKKIQAVLERFHLFQRESKSWDEPAQSLSCSQEDASSDQLSSLMINTKKTSHTLHSNKGLLGHDQAIIGVTEFQVRAVLYFHGG
eukprot:5684007-Ditylum_brightwellii.AAC.1